VLAIQQSDESSLAIWPAADHIDMSFPLNRRPENRRSAVALAKQVQS
jgi:hypothetical protein